MPNDDKLWAPWRMKYIQGAATSEESSCIFCDKQKPRDDKAELILLRGEHCFVMMNLYPYNNGHLMIAPYRHVGDIENLTLPEMSESYMLLKRCIIALRQVMAPHGFNLGINLGRVAGAGIVDHIHQHIVPRWNGDTNFMPVIADTKVISESLEEGWRRLKEAFEKGKP
jgi:ATP adenylyltransferase